MKIIVLDNSVPRVVIIKCVPLEIVSDKYTLEDFLEQNGFHCDNCSWMIIDNDQCNEIDILEFHARAEYIGRFDINTQDYYSFSKEEFDKYFEKVNESDSSNEKLE